MSQLPRLANAILDDAKITGYLLDSMHPIGGNKARYFSAFGFSLANWPDLKNALLAHPQANPVTGRTTTRHGEKFAVSCSLMTPDGRNPCIVSVWIIEPSDPNPRFVTAYPGP